MIAKVIVWDESRARAIDKMIRTLKDSIVFGVQTNIPYLIAILDHDEFRSGKMTTKFIENYFADGLKSKFDDEQVRSWAQVIKRTLKNSQMSTYRGQNGEPRNSTDSPWTSHWRGI